MRISKGDDISPVGTTASPKRDAASLVGDAVSPAGDLLASPNFGICDTTRIKTK